MVEKSFQGSVIQSEFEAFGVDNRFDEKVELAVYRVAQELVNNIIKHAGAQKVSVQVFKNGAQLLLIVEDDGKGFDFETASNSGLGMLNMKGRLQTVQGKIHFEAGPQGGTVATIKVPIQIAA